MPSGEDLGHQKVQMNVFWRSFCPSSAPLLLAGRSNCARGERTHAETDVQSQSASFRPWCGLVSPLFPPSLARLLAPTGVKLAPESGAGSWNVTFCSSSSPPPPLGASLNLSPGTDGQFGPLDLANERVVPGGVGYKDIGSLAPPTPRPRPAVWLLFSAVFSLPILFFLQTCFFGLFIFI